MTELILPLIFALLSTAGFLVSWERTNLKLHLLSGFFKQNPPLTRDEITDRVYGWGVPGELLNCKYCLSSHLAFIFTVFYTFVPELVMVLTTAFFTAPLFVLFSQGRTRPAIPVASVSTQPAQPAPPDNPELLPKPEDSVETAVQKRLRHAASDHGSHKRFMDANKDLFQLLVNPGLCDFPGCAEIISSYQKTLEAMETKYKEQGTDCPECQRGSVVREFIYRLYETRERAVQADPTP